MHYGSGAGIGSGSGSNIKFNEEVKKSKMRGQMSEPNNAVSGIEKARFCTNFLLLETAKYCLDPGTALKTFPTSQPQQIITVRQH